MYLPLISLPAFSIKLSDMPCASAQLNAEMESRRKAEMMTQTNGSNLHTSLDL